DTPEHVNNFMNMLKKFRIVEITRTGTLALTKCTESAL
ncbi:MAG: acetolactate synthase small subunit, partial [Lachnospiraceae bacterium]|nr:acetolactate synthase small subunit [Lachnospiraceae bacterium]